MKNYEVLNLSDNDKIGIKNKIKELPEKFLKMIALNLTFVEEDYENDLSQCNGIDFRFCWTDNEKEYFPCGSDEYFWLDLENFDYEHYDSLCNGRSKIRKSYNHKLLKKIFINYTNFIKEILPNTKIIYDITDGY